MQIICNDKYRGGRIPRRLDIVPSKYTLMYGKKYFVAINIHILIYRHTQTHTHTHKHTHTYTHIHTQTQ